MAYNNYFPYYYPQFTPQGYSGQSGSNYGAEQGNTYTPTNSAQNGFIWVQGETGAKAYPVAPNCTVQLWDSEAQIVYLKSADASGMPSMKILDYTIREQAGQTPAVNLSGYVTREEFERTIEEIRNESIIPAVRPSERHDAEVSGVPETVQRRSAAGGSANAKFRKNNSGTSK